MHRPNPEQWPAVVDEALEELERKLGSAYPGLLPLEGLESWSGLRVLTPDDGFILGPDPRRAALRGDVELPASAPQLPAGGPAW